MAFAEVGVLDIIKNGNSIETITLSGDGSRDFTIDANGVIRVADGITLEASRQESYVLTVHINNSAITTIAVKLKSRILSALDFGSSVEYVALSSDSTRAYVAASDNGLQIADITNPVSPVILSPIDNNTYWQINRVILSKDETKVYAIQDNYGFEVIDIDNPALPTVLSFVDFRDGVEYIALSADITKAYVFFGFNPEELKIIDISDANFPINIASVGGISEVHGIYLSTDDTKAYVSKYNSELQILDVSNPLDFAILSSTALPSVMQDIVHSHQMKPRYISQRVSLDFKLWM